MTRLQEVRIAPLPIDRFLPLVGEATIREVEREAKGEIERSPRRIYWNVNSTARGGGVAEMLRSLLAYVRGLGLDARWVVIEGPPEFFQITKRLHHALHGSLGDGSSLGEKQRAVYERVLHDNASEFPGLVHPGDVVILHDPQTAGLAPFLVRLGALVVWRCHVGSDEPGEEVARGWAFLRPYLKDVPALVFSRDAYIPDWCPRERTTVIPPSIDPFSAKNQELEDDAVRSILIRTGLINGSTGGREPVFVREDGTLGRVRRQADVPRHGPAPTWETPLVVKVSRWDPLKDHIGAMRGFAESMAGTVPGDVRLVLAGPDVRGVADDPEGAATLEQVVAAWRALPAAPAARSSLSACR